MTITALGLFKVFIWGIMAVAGFIVVAKITTPPRPGWKQVKEDQQRHVDKSRLAREGYWLDLDGKTRCTCCGSNCGQCGDDRSGMTLTEYKERYWT